jgi:hypothetical protein
MDPKVIASISGAAIVLVAIAAFGYSQLYEEKCVEDGGTVTGFLSCTIVYRDFVSVEDLVSSKYNVEYNDLVTREINVVAYPAVAIIPDRNCHQFTQDELENLPKPLTDVMAESLDEFNRDDDGDGFFSGYQNDISLDDALYLLGKYDFQLTTKKVDGTTLPKLQDTEYVFECIFEDGSHQYKIGIRFNTHYDGYGRLVFVNFTKDNFGFPVIDNDNLILYSGGFNQTVVFKNNLDHDITLQIINPKVPEEYSQREVPEETIIPAGKVWSYFFRKDSPVDVLAYQFTAIPDNLNGIILLKGYPRCMTQSEVVSLYSQVEAYPKFPSYLPDGYSFECGVHNMNAFVHLVYFTDELRQKFQDNANAAFDMEFFASGGIRVDYYNDFILSNWTENPNYDKYQKVAEGAAHPKANTLTIGGDPAVMIKEYFWRNGEQKSFNRLEIFSDNEIRYMVRSGLPESEVIKIAESLFTS